MTPDSADLSGEDLRIARALLAGTNPSPRTEATEEERREAQRLIQALIAHPGQEMPDGRRRRPGRRSTRARALLASAAAVTVMVVLLVTAVVVGGGGSAVAAPLLPAPLLTATTGDHETAVGILLDAAQRQREMTVPGTGQVHYTRLQSYGLQTSVARSGATTVIVTRIIQMWRRPDGSRLIEQSLQGVDRAGRAVGGPTPPEEPGYRRIEAPPAEAGVEVALLPTDPDQLYAHLLSSYQANQGVTATPADITRLAYSHLKGGGTSPQQNAALYELFARDPAVFATGPVTDRAGRPARSVGIRLAGTDGSRTSTGYLLVSDDGTPLTAETVFAPDAPPGLELPPGPTVAEYSQFTDERQVITVGDLR
ncbi:hypothetical protein CC117_24445 [Parafrankia colletiae]|uniref:Uncharacterized protein n=1 Tax=Parafrankia colletiae TaxID=573497 RepID=A0A1S1QGY6_9ACTN|nr:CU044_5270 family protein [Parafrankia colletiae]MCK9901665.1 CU044_5270 family protein [Frankia sp. Cpl3]OHV32701.1 hypothetical protein CC117_24445 [Parafrankia colletiae]